LLCRHRDGGGVVVDEIGAIDAEDAEDGSVIIVWRQCMGSAEK